MPSSLNPSTLTLNDSCWLCLGASGLVFGLTIAALYARSLRPTPEVEMVREVRNMTMNDIEVEIALVEAEFAAVKDGIYKFMHHPVDVLLPGAIGQLVSAVIKGLGAAKK